ncbi:MAG: c-type cytochrome [Nitrospinaceae bacterium]|nr:c-type cytochrome [Nitrospinaceae bacterium]NIR53532.1 c-type cytochrome [Nitrospinaceae bacterium]NIS83933.1 c-type cytochrome [Nitrospinaceae bacterium]NIT80742.1 c-type cytochrome [Nitrospinaceae bacterium]NIU43048.1 c-type cytochrome [Nitrospinaceae bacterium]
MKIFPRKTLQRFGWLLILSLGWTGEVTASPALVKQYKCQACHRLSADQAPEELSAPDLFYAGDKFQKSWLERFLQHPEPIRPAGHTRDPGFLKGKPEASAPHPRLNPGDARQMADHLGTLKIMKTEKPLDLPALSKGMRVRVKILFERDYGCIACHQSYNLARQPRGGVSGPSLLDAGNRLRPEWVYQWLTAPKRFVPKGRMPAYAFDDETARKMTQYLMSHKKEPVKP